MAQLNGTTKWIGLIMTFLAFFASVVVAFTLTQAKTCEIEKRMERIITDGTKLSQKNHEEVLLIKKDLEYIKKGIDEIKAEVKKP